MIIVIRFVYFKIHSQIMTVLENMSVSMKFNTEWDINLKIYTQETVVH